MIKLNKNTKIFFSASSKPGNFGTTIYNQLFEKYGINAIYLPRAIVDAKKLIDAICTLDISGCSVSMPLKTKVIPLLDELDEIAKQTNSVNTIVNNDGKLKGYNTDVYGATQAIQHELQPKTTVIYGAGSVSGSLITALKACGCNDIVITARDHHKAQATAEKFQVKYSKIGELGNKQFDLMINATPASINKENLELFSLINHTKAVFDLVVSDTTSLIAEAKAKSLKTINGLQMSKHQLQKQFYHYTNITPTLEEIENAIKLT